MTGRSPQPLPRWIAALLLGALLLAAQQLALLHPLSHLHDEAPATEAADPLGCGLCLAGAAASPLATATPMAALAVPGGAVAVAGAAPCRLVARAPSTGHNRGPPGTRLTSATPTSAAVRARQPARTQGCATTLQDTRE